MLTRHQAERVEYLVGLWLDYVEKTDIMDRIINGGPTMMDKLRVFRGELPPGSDVKPDAIGGKADWLRRVQITTEERRARALLKSMSLRERELLCIWPSVKKKHNEGTQERWTMTDVAALLRLSVSDFKQQREIASFRLLELDSVQKNGSI